MKLEENDVKILINSFAEEIEELSDKQQEIEIIDFQ